MRVVKKSKKSNELSIKKLDNSYIIIVNYSGNWCYVVNDLDRGIYILLSIDGIDIVGHQDLTTMMRYTGFHDIKDIFEDHSIIEMYCYKSFRESCEFLLNVL